MRKLLFLGVMCVGAASAQALSVGVLAGAPFEDVVKAGQANNLSVLPKSTNFVIGPEVQLDLPLSLRLELDALYRPYSFSISNLAGNVSAAQWRFPLLAQYRFKLPIVKPFIEAGPSFDHLSNISSAIKSIPSGPGQLIHQSNAGFVIGGGADLKLPIVRLSAELRYTRQTSDNFRGISNLNQAEFLVGIHF